MNGDGVMRIKTSKDLVPGLRGSAFRRVTCDARTWYLEEIMTLQTLRHHRKRPLPTARAKERISTRNREGSLGRRL